MQEERYCEYCGTKEPYLVIYEFDHEVYETYLCEACDHKDIDELEEEPISS